MTALNEICPDRLTAIAQSGSAQAMQNALLNVSRALRASCVEKAGIEGREQMSKQTNPADTSAHTPTPWRTSYDGWEVTASPLGVLESSKRVCSTANLILSDEHVKANAAFIVRACNAHDDLVAALRRAEDVLAGVELTDYPVSEELEIVRTALAKATK